MSTLVDIIRIIASLFVFLGHTNFNWFFGSSSVGPQNGQDYVIIFFVLSGFVIAWSVDKKKMLTFPQYTFDRLSRLWSVVLPALAIGFLLDWLGQRIHPSTYESILSNTHQGTKILLSSLFLHETWFFSIRPGSNGPFWSLSYEFFYYMIFGSIMLLPTVKTKLIWGLLWITIAGPKLILLFPCWLLGCLSYYGCKHYRIKAKVAALLAIVSGYFVVELMIKRWSHWGPWQYEGLGSPPLFYSAKYLDDYCIALAMALFLLSMNRWFSIKDKVQGSIPKIIKNCASYSFSVYAIHFPVMAFTGATLPAELLGEFTLLIAILFVLLFCALFAQLFELPLKKYRGLILSYFPGLKQKCGIRS